MLVVHCVSDDCPLIISIDVHVVSLVGLDFIWDTSALCVVEVWEYALLVESSSLNQGELVGYVLIGVGLLVLKEANDVLEVTSTEEDAVLSHHDCSVHEVWGDKDLLSQVSGLLVRELLDQSALLRLQSLHEVFGKKMSEVLGSLGARKNT